MTYFKGSKRAPGQILLNSHFDSDKSEVHDIRLKQNGLIEVDACEYWARDYYDRLMGV